MDDVAKLIDSVAKLIGALVWPALIVFIVVRFGSAFSDFFSDLTELTFKGAGFEASAKRKQREATAALVAAEVSRPQEGATPEIVAEQAKAAAQLVVDNVTPGLLRRAGRSTVLWVDDRPKNNVHERQALEALGVNFVISTSTEDALEKMNRQSFDAIISDMSRPSDPRAGFTLLDKLRSDGNRTPFIVYAGPRALEQQAELVRRGATGSTNRPSELFEMVLNAVGRKT